MKNNLCGAAMCTRIRIFREAGERGRGSKGEREISQVNGKVKCAPTGYNLLVHLHVRRRNRRRHRPQNRTGAGRFSYCRNRDTRVAREARVQNNRSPNLCVWGGWGGAQLCAHMFISSLFNLMSPCIVLLLCCEVNQFNCALLGLCCCLELSYGHLYARDFACSH